MSFPPNPHAERGWTRHGHPIPGAVQVDPRPRVMRCGGPVLCRACQGDVAAWQAEHSERPEAIPGAVYVAPVGTRPGDPGWQRLSSATLAGPRPDVPAALSALRAAEWEVRTDRAHGHLSSGIVALTYGNPTARTYTRTVAASPWREASAEPAPVRVVGNPPDVAPLAELSALLAEPEPARLPTGYVSLLAANAREAVDALANAPLLARTHAPQDPLTRAAVEAEHALRSLYALALDRLRVSDAEAARPAPHVPRGFRQHEPTRPAEPGPLAQGEDVDVEPTPGAPLECTCRTCESGALTAGHCVDADDAPWHACRATRAVYGVGETPDETPGGTDEPGDA